MQSRYDNETRSIQSKYNYSEAWQWLQAKGIEQFGQKFQLYEEDKRTIYLLLSYFLQDDVAASQLGIDLSKGVLLNGPVGCGKTSLMRLMKYFAVNSFVIKPCRDVAFEFIHDGFEVIHRYSRGTLYQYMPRIFCFDDLGTETSMKYYGNECNVMAEILLTRYDLFVGRRLITHLTTNLSAGEIETIYGNRIRSRLRELFNLISFDKNSVDKRQ